jgi:hypothetical protein
MSTKKKNSLQSMRKSYSKSVLGIFSKALRGEPLTDKEMDTLNLEMYNNPEGMISVEENFGKEAVDTFYYDLLSSPEMIARAEKLQKAGRIKQGLQEAVGAFNSAYDLYLAGEQKRIGKEELASVKKAQKPGKIEAIPELEDAIRRARELGDPTAAISQLEQGIERSTAGATRAAQLSSRGQAGGLQSQIQAIHQQDLAQRGQIPLMAQELKRQSLSALSPLVAQKQAIQAQNVGLQAQMYPYDLDRQLREEEAAGLAIAGGTMGQRGAIQGLMGQVPQLASNLYSQQYAHLPPEVAPYVSRLDYGLNG